MPTTTPHLLVASAALVLLAACELTLGLPDEITTSAVSGASTGDTVSPSSTDASSADAASSADGDSSSGGPSSPTSNAGDVSSDGSSSATDTAGGCVGDLPDGEFCEDRCACSSSACFRFPEGSLLHGVCGGCESDQDCRSGGCSLPSWLWPGPDGTWTPPSCNTGELGETCQSDAACQAGLVCVEMFDIVGLFAHSTCSECSDDADCDAGSICSPTYDVLATGGYRSCVAAGTLPVGASCDPFGNGASACASGICSWVDVASEVAVAVSGFDIGVCGECVLNDCVYPLDCSGPQVDPNTLEVIPATCIPKGTL